MDNRNILFLFESAVGYGHQRRTSGIVNGLVDAGFKVNVASGSFVDASDYFNPRADLLTLPINHRTRNGVVFHYDENQHLTEDRNIDWAEWHRQRVAAIRPVAEKSRIDAMMVEWWPFNRRKEFDRIIDAVINIQQERFGTRPLVISCVRDNPKTGGENGSSVVDESSILKTINQDVDAVFIYGDPDLNRLEDSYSSLSLLRKPIVYMGYVVNEHAKERNSSRENTVIVSCGSGDDGHHLLKGTVRAMPFSQSLQEHEWHFVTGRRMEVPHRQEFLDAARQVGRPIVVHNDIAGLPEVISRSGFSVSAAGYNTTLEVLASGTPGILTPKFFVKDDGAVVRTDEQWNRLVRLHRRGMASIADPQSVMDPHRFAAMIDRAYAKGPLPFTLNVNGAEKTVAEVERMISARSVWHPANRQILVPNISIAVPMESEVPTPSTLLSKPKMNILVAESGVA